MKIISHYRSISIKVLCLWVLGGSMTGYSETSEESLVEDFKYFFGVTISSQFSNPDSASIYLDSALTVAMTIEESYYLGQALQFKSRLHFFKTESDSAFKYCEKSILILSEYEDSVEYFMAEYNLGNIFLQTDDHIQGLIQFKKVLRIIDDKFEHYMSIDPERVNLNRAYCHVSIGLVYYYLKDYKIELDHLQKGLKITYKVDTDESEYLRAVALGNIGEAYYSLGNYEAAEAYAIAGLEIKNKLEMGSSIGYNYSTLAKAALGRDKLNLCLKYLLMSDKKFSEINNEVELNRNKFWRAKALMRKGHINAANKILFGLEDIYTSSFSKLELSELYDLMSELQATQRNFKQATEYLSVSQMIKEEVDSKNDKKMVGEFLNFFEEEEIKLNDRIQNLKNLQETEKLELKMNADNEKRVWVYSLFLVSIICLVLIIIIIARAYQRNKKINLDLNHSIDEKQILFKEVHHRVKNNFQIISSLLNLQQGIEENERGKKVLSDAQGRIQSMSLVHELLYRKNEAKKIDFKDYTHELVDSIFHSFSMKEKGVQHQINCQNESFDLDVAVPLGLILNEAITNSVKYAFLESQQGEIEIQLKAIDEHNFELFIKDNGPGIPDIYINGGEETLGIELINILSDQLGGRVEISNQKGTVIKVSFKTI